MLDNRFSVGYFLKCILYYASHNQCHKLRFLLWHYTVIIELQPTISVQYFTIPCHIPLSYVTSWFFPCSLKLDERDRLAIFVSFLLDFEHSEEMWVPVGK